MQVAVSYITQRKESISVRLDEKTEDETQLRVSFSPTNDDTVIQFSTIRKSPFPIYLDLWERVL